MNNFIDKKALIIGASGGMGSAVASMLSKNGVHCFLVGRSQEKLNDIFSSCSSYGNPCFMFSCDISDMTEIKQCSENAIKSLGGLNFLIHCAGDYNKALADECDLEIWDKIIDINLRSTYHFARNVLPEINKNSGGAVIRINSRDAPHTGIGSKRLRNELLMVTWKFYLRMLERMEQKYAQLIQGLLIPLWLTLND